MPRLAQVAQVPETQLVAIADALLAEVATMADKRLALDQIDAVLGANQIMPIPVGRLGRDDWNFFRLRLLARINRHLRQTEGKVLKVIAHGAGGATFYGLVPASDVVVRAPWNTTKGYETRLRRDLRALHREYLSQTELPDGADAGSLKEFHDYLDQRFTNYINMIVGDIVIAARAHGLVDRLPAAATEKVAVLPSRRAQRRISA